MTQLKKVYILLFMSQAQPLSKYFLSVPQCVCFNLRKTARSMTQLYDEALRPTGLRATQFSLLSVTRYLGTATINQLAEVMVMDRTTLTRNLKPLENQGYLHVHPGKDRRQREVTLRAAGNKILDQALPLWEGAQTHVVQSLGKDRVGRLLKDLQHATTQTAMR